jgi:hypothetical protein
MPALRQPLALRGGQPCVAEHADLAHHMVPVAWYALLQAWAADSRQQGQPRQQCHSCLCTFCIAVGAPVS